MSILHGISFYTSVNDLNLIPSFIEKEIAFAGRSNAGKSSAINTLTNHGGLAYVSKTPGRTQLINYFKLNDHLFIVDLPGYGYAKVPLSIRLHWEKLLSKYLQTRVPLCGMILIMDARHPLTNLDTRMLDWFVPTGKSVHILLTKADKLKRQQAVKTLNDVRIFLKCNYSSCTAQLFSSLHVKGVEEASNVIHEWLGLGSNHGSLSASKHLK